MSNNLGAPVSFLNAPDIKVGRSAFDLSYRVNSGCNAGFLCPLGEPIEVLPGDTFTIDLAHLTRMTPTINVPMDNIYLDVYFFYVPNRIVWEHWEEFISGENKNGPWVPATTYSVPQIKVNTTSSTFNYIKPDTVLSYMGCPTCFYDPDASRAVSAGSINALPVRGFVKIYNEYFRDENINYPMIENKGDSDINFNTGLGYLTSGHTGGALPPVCKLPDLFTTCKPAPQYGDAVSIPSAPVVPGAKNDISLFTTQTTVDRGISPTNTSWTSGANINLGGNSSGQLAGASQFSASYNNVQLSNLHTLGPTIRQLQIAELSQVYLERLLRGGHRYREYIKTIFNVVTPDASVQIPEYLGGKTFNINISPVVQTSETNNTAKGSVSGYSSSSGRASMFTKSFTEHGFVIPVYTIRYQHTYSQGISKMWKKKSALEFYNPIFANIGYQPVMTQEIYTGELAHSGNAAITYNSEDVFGYQEAWYDYRYRTDKNVGFMRLNNYTDRYGDAWSFGDIYSAQPTLSSSWLVEDYQNLNRVLSVSGSSTVPQFISDFYIKFTAVRRMPVYSIPGLGHI